MKYKGWCRLWVMLGQKNLFGVNVFPRPTISNALPSWVLVHLADQPSLQVVELQQTLAQKDQVLSKLEQSLRLMEEASFDGTFLWKITNVTRRCHESVCGRTVSLFSPGNSSWAQRVVGETDPGGPRRHEQP